MSRTDDYMDASFDPMEDEWTGERTYEAVETDAEGVPFPVPEWKTAAGYTLPMAARIIRESVTGPEIMPADPREMLLSSALALAAFACWIPRFVTKTLIAYPEDTPARIMVSTAAAMTPAPIVGKSEAGIWVNTRRLCVYNIPDAIYAGNCLASTAQKLPNDITLDDIAEFLDLRASGLGQWRAACAVIAVSKK